MKPAAENDDENQDTKLKVLRVRTPGKKWNRPDGFKARVDPLSK